MKVWILSLCGLLSFLIVGYLVQIYLDKSADRLNQKLATVEPDLVARDWDQSLRKLKSVKNNWKKTKPFWAVLTNHKEMDLVEEALIKTIKAISSKSYVDAQINLGVLRDFVNHIPERERFSIVNVF